MRRVKHLLDTSTPIGEKDPQDCADYVEKWVEVSGSFTGDLMVQGRLEAAWADIDTAAGGDVTLIECLPPFVAIRVDTSGVSGGIPVVWLIGRDRRTAE
jgi:hypothetical protein